MSSILAIIDNFMKRSVLDPLFIGVNPVSNFLRSLFGWVPVEPRKAITPPTPAPKEAPKSPQVEQTTPSVKTVTPAVTETGETVYPVVAPKEQVATQYKCPYCGKTFLSQAECTSHMNSCPNAPSVKCHYCGKTFSNQSQLNTHIQTYHMVVHSPIEERRSAPSTLEELIPKLDLKKAKYGSFQLQEPEKEHNESARRLFF